MHLGDARLPGELQSFIDVHCLPIGKEGRTYLLDFNALCPIHVVAFTVRGKILGVCRRGWLKVLRILCQLQSFGLLA